jgi:dTDP-4-dehydrorhamnose reductase
MSAPSIMLFGARGYVGGTVAIAARKEGNVIEVGSNNYPFWIDEHRWPLRLLRSPAGTAILAANFEEAVVQDRAYSETLLLWKLGALLNELRVRRIIFLSTDAVFSGHAGKYLESDKTESHTRYGKCKAAMERVVVSHPKGHVVRMSAVWGHGSTKPDPRRERILQESGDRLQGATNVYKSPINVHVVAKAVLRMTRERELPKILHLAAPRMSYLEFMRTLLLPQYADRIASWVEPSWDTSDSSLQTKYPSLIQRLLA